MTPQRPSGGQGGRIEVVPAEDGGGPRLRLRGDWTLPHYAALASAVAGLEARPALEQLELDRLGALDTAGAALIVRLVGPEQARALARSAPQLAAERRKLLAAVAEATPRGDAEPAPPRPMRLPRALAALGRRVERGAEEVAGGLAFMGVVVATFAAGALRPGRWRLAALSHQLQRTAAAAVPIVALLTFAVGAVVAMLGATVLGRFGAAVFTVDLVTYAFLREFGVVLTAVLLAGRSASAFTAEIGAMKANEELDAMRAQGFNPLEMLVAPRVLALVIALPLLSFVAVICGLAGGATVVVPLVELPPSRFAALVGEVEASHYLAGLVKAPLFAFVVAVIGCREGLKSGANAQSVGAHTTSAVVQSIFWVIILDAAAALFFVEVGW